MRLEEIEARLAEIKNQLDNNPESIESVDALSEEVRSLDEEMNAIITENEKKDQLRKAVAEGKIGETKMENIEERTLTTEEIEVRSFADFIRGTATQMRANEQNFSFGNNGAVIPTSIAKKVIQAVKDRCPIFAGAEIYHVKGTLKIPVYGPKTVAADSSVHDITVAYGSDFAELTADAGAFTSVDLTGYLIGALTLIGRTLQNSSEIDIVNFVVSKMADKIASFVENELLNGTGADNNHCTGALNTTNTMNAGSTSAISADNLIDLQAKVKQVYQPNACWTMAPATFTAIKKLKDANGKYLIQDSFSDAFPFRLLGKPVYLSDNMPAIGSGNKAVLYGDYTGLAVNVRENVSVEVLREKYATQHAIGVVAWMELDSKIQDNSKLATLVMSAG